MEMIFRCFDFMHHFDCALAAFGQGSISGKYNYILKESFVLRWKKTRA